LLIRNEQRRNPLDAFSQDDYGSYYLFGRRGPGSLPVSQFGRGEGSVCPEHVTFCPNSPTNRNQSEPGDGTLVVGSEIMLSIIVTNIYYRYQIDAETLLWH
jgi:hypothetical protein